MDYDFITLESFINAFEEYGPIVFERYGINIADYVDLIPTDLIENNPALKEIIKESPKKSKDAIQMNEEEFDRQIGKAIAQFNHSVVNQSSYKLLWNDDGTPRNENRVQDLLLNTIYSYCSNNGIDIAKEPNMGRGPVDFKFSHGSLKVLLEVKLASNAAFWHGLEVQTIQYMVSENIKKAIFLVIVYYQEEFEKVKNIQMTINQLNKDYAVQLITYVVDATKEKPSASKIPDKNLINIYKNIGE